MSTRRVVKPLKRVFTVGTLIILLSPLACLADLYSGSLTGSGGGITATDGWNATATTLDWAVTSNADGSLHYKYTFTVPTTPPIKGLSHIIIEVSDDFDYGAPDYFNGPVADLDTYGPGSGNPGMPGDMKGLKFEGFAGSSPSWVVEFDSWRLPMWGDFYAKDGVHEGVEVIAYNTDFGQAGDFKIAVPDTAYVPVPAAVLLGMLGMGVAGLKLRRFA